MLTLVPTPSAEARAKFAQTSLGCALANYRRLTEEYSALYHSDNATLARITYARKDMEAAYDRVMHEASKLIPTKDTK